MSSTRQLAAIMFTDIVGYTALMGEDEERALALLRQNRAILKEYIEEFGGRWIKEIGDGTLSTFQTASDAVLCAIKIMGACEAVDDLQLRIAIHLGEITIENDDIFGEGVNITSRLEELTPANNIYISESVERNVRNKQGIQTTFVKEEALKHVKNAVRVYRVETQPAKESAGATAPGETKPAKKGVVPMLGIVAAVFVVAVLGVWLFQNYQAKDNQQTVDMAMLEPTKEKSIAVLPFFNTKPSEETDYLGFAVANQVIGDLAYLQDIQVKAASAVRKYADQVVDATTVGAELQVNYVMIGTYLNDGNRIRLNVELVDVATGEMMWREPIEVNYENAFQLQDMVAKAVVERLNVQFTEAELVRLGRDVSLNPLAYEYYLRGLSYPLSNEGDRLAINMFEQSIALDSTYAPAFVELGNRIHGLAQFGLLDPEETKKAEQYLLHALSLNSASLGALTNLSILYTETARGAEAVEISRRVLDINPNNARAHFSLGYIYRYAGMLEESVAEMERAVALDPTDPSFRSLGVTYLNLGEYDKAFEALNIDEGSAYAVGYQGLIYARQGNMEQALTYFDQVIAMESQRLWTLVALTLKSYIEGDTAAGLAAVQELELANLEDAEAWYYWGAHNVLLGDKEGYIRCFNQAMDKGYFNYPWMKRDPFLKDIQDDPEFKEVLEEARAKHEAFKARFF